MPVFVVLARANEAEAAQQLERHYQGQYLRYDKDNHVWFLATKGTVQQIAKKLRDGIQDEEEPPEGLRGVIVIKITASYFGLSSQELWDWFEAAFRPSDD